jgi:hypothetical protein
MLVSSVPLSETQLCGRSQRTMRASSSRTTRPRRIGHQAQALPGVVVDHRQDPEPSSIGQCVADEVERPALVRALWQRHLCPCAQGPLASTTAANLQPLLDVEPPQLLVVHMRALARQQHMQPSPAEATAHRRQFPQPRPHRAIVRTTAPVADRGPLSTPIVRHARRWLTPCTLHRCAAASRWAAGVTIFLSRYPSASRCPASPRPAAS